MERELSAVAVSKLNQELAEWLCFVRKGMRWRQIDMAEKLSQIIGVPFSDSAIGWWEKSERSIPGVVISALVRATGAPEPWKSRELWEEWKTYREWQWVKTQVAADKKKGRKSAG